MRGGGSRSARRRAAGIHKTPGAEAPGLPLTWGAVSADSQRRERGAESFDCSATRSQGAKLKV